MTAPSQEGCVSVPGVLTRVKEHRLRGGYAGPDGLPFDPLGAPDFSRSPSGARG